MDIIFDGVTGVPCRILYLHFDTYLKISKSIFSVGLPAEKRKKVSESTTLIINFIAQISPVFMRAMLLLLVPIFLASSLGTSFPFFLIAISRRRFQAVCRIHHNAFLQLYSSTARKDIPENLLLSIVFSCA